MKETAVEWLYNNLKSHFEHNGDLLEIVQMSFEQAKAMEREYIVDAYIFGIKDEYVIGAEQYYNQIYKSEQ